MPSVDPSRLARELDSLVDLLPEPEEAVRACLNFLDFYADRTRRPNLKSTADLEPKFGVPGPVVRELSRRLSRAAQDLPDRGDRLTDALWESGFRETRLVAGTIYERRDDDRVATWVRAHALACSDPVVLKHLGRHALLGWRSTAPDRFLECLWSWLDERNPHLTIVALSALCDATAQPTFALAPSLFQGLTDRLDDLAKRSSRLTGDLIRAMASRSPAETAQLLKRSLREGEERRPLVAMINAVLPSFPERQRQLLRVALSDAGSD